MTEHAQPRIWAGIDIPKTLAGTLAAVSAAVVGSFLGVAGTLIGAALVSLISSIATEIYHRYLERGTKKLQAAFVTTDGTPSSAFVPSAAAVGTPQVAAGHHPASEAPVSPAAPHPPIAAHVAAPARSGAAPHPAGTHPVTTAAPVRRIRWKRVALVAGALFLLAMGTLTTAELLAGRSAQDATSGRDSGAPTVFNWTGNHSDDDRKPAPAGTPTDSGPTSDPRPAGTDATTTPGDSGTGSTEPAPGPTTEAPADPTPTGGSETGSGQDSGSPSGEGAEQQGATEQSQQ
ncbi:hypothetical protein ACTOB_007162 [Actinoplanes oblitus]|uniref:Uncharacterized protein n=1 Tax=Actinoplanes oblitus TaxID=3040509 RepID=A0ABY8WB78_9ACTN|nr:hypothetical protein [Actinoplanes oblitus]WIM95091.1 hypothetical protein ACTOB_007162 [Actinoplanes oblitus]